MAEDLAKKSGGPPLPDTRTDKAQSSVETPSNKPKKRSSLAISISQKPAKSKIEKSGAEDKVALSARQLAKPTTKATPGISISSTVQKKNSGLSIASKSANRGDGKASPKPSTKPAVASQDKLGAAKTAITKSSPAGNEKKATGLSIASRPNKPVADGKNTEPPATLADSAKKAVDAKSPISKSSPAETKKKGGGLSISSKRRTQNTKTDEKSGANKLSGRAEESTANGNPPITKASSDGAKKKGGGLSISSKRRPPKPTADKATTKAGAETAQKSATSSATPDVTDKPGKQVVDTPEPKSPAASKQAAPSKDTKAQESRAAKLAAAATDKKAAPTTTGTPKAGGIQPIPATATPGGDKPVSPISLGKDGEAPKEKPKPRLSAQFGEPETLLALLEPDPEEVTKLKQGMKQDRFL